MPRLTDEHLAWWGDRFVEAGLASTMPFEIFMGLAADSRQRLVMVNAEARQAEALAEAALPQTAELHDQHMVDPMRPTSSEWGRPWFFAGRARRKQFRHRRTHGR